MDQTGSKTNGNGKRPSNSTGPKDIEPEAKRQKHIQEHAQSRLSKWAARLFDPDRPKGVIEPPQTIPLNDEFLQAFGRREKEHDQKTGKTLAVDNDLASDNEDGDAQPNDTNKSKTEAGSKKGSHKIKITNLKYTTTEEALRAACQAFGTCTVNLIMDESDNQAVKPLNSGRAYVAFENADSAKECMEKLDSLDGRPLRIEPASQKNPNSRQGEASRYYIARDVSKISMKCFRCGQPGHMEAECTNPSSKKRCPLCASTDHDMRACPIKAVCFNCGIPGHVSKNCTQQRGRPPRAICSICFSVGHSKYQCAPDYTTGEVAAQYAQSMDSDAKGILMSRQMRWAGTIMGVYCSNCGDVGHIGKQCRRPTLDECQRDNELARRELHNASNFVSSPPPRPPHAAARGRQMNEHHNDNQRRANSAPPRRELARHSSMPSRYDTMPPRHNRHQSEMHQSAQYQNGPLRRQQSDSAPRQWRR